MGKITLHGVNIYDDLYLLMHTFAPLPFQLLPYRLFDQFHGLTVIREFEQQFHQMFIPYTGYTGLCRAQNMLTQCRSQPVGKPMCGCLDRILLSMPKSKPYKPGKRGIPELPAFSDLPLVESSVIVLLNKLKHRMIGSQGLYQHKATFVFAPGPSTHLCKHLKCTLRGAEVRKPDELIGA